MIARNIFRKMFERMGGVAGDQSIRAEFADKSVYENHPGKSPDLLLRFKTPRAEWYSLIFFYQGLFECYIEQEVDIEGERPITVLAELGKRAGLQNKFLGFRRNPLNTLRQMLQEQRQDNTERGRAIENADFHYALHPALFEHMLGETVGYSEGLWTETTDNINQAKYNNYEYLCRKLRLEPGIKVLEVGSGWGYMPIYMAKKYGADVTVYNPVRRQNDYMRERFQRHGVDIRLVEGDHRDIFNEPGAFDRFISIGVHEHAGFKKKLYRLWANSIATALKPGGLGVISTTSLMHHQMTEFLTLKYIFPGGHLPSLPETLAAFDEAGLMMVEVENLWPQYKRTVGQWVENFARGWPEIQKADPATFDERFRRLWTMYLQGTFEVFSTGLDLSHIVFTKGRSIENFPWGPGDSVGFEPMGGDQQPECYR